MNHDKSLSARCVDFHNVKSEIRVWLFLTQLFAQSIKPDVKWHFKQMEKKIVYSDNIAISPPLFSNALKSFHYVRRSSERLILNFFEFQMQN